MALQKLSSLARLPEFELTEGTYRRASAAYVHKTLLNPESLLVGNRYKDSDPLRKNKIVIPCGGLLENETFLDAAIRETREETGVDAIMLDNYPSFSEIEGAPYLKEYGPVVSLISPDGTIWAFGRDNKKGYIYRLVNLYPLSEPREMHSDLKNPRYERINILKNGNLMPELGMAADLILRREHKMKIKKRTFLDADDFSGFMREATLL